MKVDHYEIKYDAFRDEYDLVGCTDEEGLVGCHCGVFKSLPKAKAKMCKLIKREKGYKKEDYVLRFDKYGNEVEE